MSTDEEGGGGGRRGREREGEIERMRNKEKSPFLLSFFFSSLLSLFLFPSLLLSPPDTVSKHC